MIVCVGGPARKIGKSSVVAALIRALPEAGWTAVKVSRHSHSGAPGAAPALREQVSADSTDTGRFLAAGAARAYLIEAEGGALERVMPALEAILASAENLIVESSSLAAWIRPDLYLMVIDPAAGEWKPGARAQIELADAFILIDRGSPADPRLPPSKPCFPVRPPAFVSPELVAFVAERLAPQSGCGKLTRNTTAPSRSP